MQKRHTSLLFGICDNYLSRNSDKFSLKNRRKNANFLPSRYFPEFEIVLSHNSTQFTEFPSPAQRVACRWNDKCRSTNLKKFSKIEQVAAPGPRASRHSACSFSKRDGQNSRQRPTQRLYPPIQVPPLLLGKL